METMSPVYCCLCDRRLENVAQVVELRCQHEFCVDCFQRYREDKQSGSTMRLGALPCPVCRTVVEIPSPRSAHDSSLPGPAAAADDEVQEDVKEEDGQSRSPGPLYAPAPTTSEQTFVFPSPRVEQTAPNHDADEQVMKLESTTKQREGVDSLTDGGCHWRLTLRPHTAPTGVSFTSQGHLALACHGAGTIKILRPRSWETLQLIDNAIKPFSVCCVPAGAAVASELGCDAAADALLIGDRRSKTVIAVDASTGDELLRWISGTFSWLGGIATLPDDSGGRVLVNCRQLHAIGVYTADGQLLRQFATSAGDDRHPDVVDHLTASRRRLVAAADSANHCVKLFDAETGELVRRVGAGRGDADGQLVWPKGVCVDDVTGDLVVADCCNARVSRFDAGSGRFIEHVLADIERPYAVAYRSEGGKLLAVTHYALTGRSQCDLYRLVDYRSSSF